MHLQSYTVIADLTCAFGCLLHKCEPYFCSEDLNEVAIVHFAWIPNDLLQAARANAENM